jgi:hypothetical protein
MSTNLFKTTFLRILSEDANTAAGVFGPAAAAAAADPAMQGPGIYAPSNNLPIDPSRATLGSKAVKGKKKNKYRFPIARRQSVKM